jgi:hypothetical protein
MTEKKKRRGPRTSDIQTTMNLPRSFVDMVKFLNQQHPGDNLAQTLLRYVQKPVQKAYKEALDAKSAELSK